MFTKRRIAICTSLIFVLAAGVSVSADDDVTVVAPTSEAADGLDLQAVGELFKDSKNLEEFEKSLNDPDNGINNLDLDENGEVDFIRVVEEVADNTHVIILQAALGEDDFQDVATIEVEKESDDKYNMQVHGNVIIYGEDYYVAPAVVHVHTWPIITWIYRPVYRPYRSVYYWGHYPRWWRPFHPVSVHVYRTRTVRLTRHNTFTVTRTTRVRTVNKVSYKSRTSVRVTKKTRVNRTTKATVKKTNVTKTAKSGKAAKVEKSGKTKQAAKANKAGKSGKAKSAKAQKAGKKNGKTKAAKAGRKKTVTKKSGKKKGAKSGKKKSGGKRKKG